MHKNAPVRVFPVTMPDLTDQSHPCACGTCPLFIYSGTFCSSCLVHCDVDFGALFPETDKHRPINDAAALRLLSDEVA